MRDSRPTTFSGWFLYIAAGWGLSVPTDDHIRHRRTRLAHKHISSSDHHHTHSTDRNGSICNLQAGNKVDQSKASRELTPKSPAGTAREDALETPEPTATQTPEPATQQAPETKKRADTRDVTAENRKTRPTDGKRTPHPDGVPETKKKDPQPVEQRKHRTGRKETAERGRRECTTSQRAC